MKPTCSNCNTAKKIGPNDYACQAHPPTPVFLGMRQVRAAFPHVVGVNAPVAQEPVISSQYPVMGAMDWCREHQLAEVTSS